MSIELPNRKVRPVNGHHKSSSNNMGTNKHRGETNKDRKAAAQIATVRNRKVMVLEGGRKIRWYRATDWYALPGHGKDDAVR